MNHFAITLDFYCPMNEEGSAMRVCVLVGFICALILLTDDTVSAQDLKFFEGHAVKSNGTGAKKLKFKDTDATNTEEFVGICRSICEDGDADGKNGSCGGFVVNYTNRSKSTPKHCVFKKEGSQPYKKPAKDTYLLPANPCQNCGTFNNESATCDCYSGYDGDNCENEAECNQLNKQKATHVRYEYDPPLNESNLFDVSAEISWTDINGIDAYGKKGIYEAFPIDIGQFDRGYFGAQIKGSSREDMLLFSIWDADDGSQVWPMHENCNRNCNDCGSSSHAGMGVKCAYDLPMDEGERYTMRIQRTAEQGTYTAETETYTGPVWQVTAVAEGSDDEIIVGEILFQDMDPDQGLSQFDMFHEFIGCTLCASFNVKVGRKDPIIHSPATTVIVGASGNVNGPNNSCDLYNITRQGDSIFFENGPGTEPDFARSERIELFGE